MVTSTSPTANAGSTTSFHRGKSKLKHARGHRGVTLRQIYFSAAFVVSLAWAAYWARVTNEQKRRIAYFRHSRNRHINDNARTILSCVHNPLLERPRRPEMWSAHSALYPFPEYTSTCRGHDGELPPDYMLENYVVTDRDGWKEAYFRATRGLLEFILFATWDYRFDYNRRLFRTDRRASLAVSIVSCAFAPSPLATF